MHTYTTFCIYNIGNKDCNGALNEYIIPISLTEINHQKWKLVSEKNHTNTNEGKVISPFSLSVFYILIR